MADSKAEDKDDKDGEAAAAGKKKSGLVKVILIVVGGLVALGATAGLTAFITAKMMHTGGDAGDAATAEGSQDGAKDKGKADKAKGKAKPKKAPLYFAFDPAFIVNFQDQSGMRYLQVTVEAMTREEDVVAALEANKPQIRNNLIMLFSGLSVDTIKTVEGKQKIRDSALEEIQKVLTEEIGKPGVEQVYFTSFVMQ